LVASLKESVLPILNEGNDKSFSLDGKDNMSNLIGSYFSELKIEESKLVQCFNLQGGLFTKMITLRMYIFLDYLS
jgi:hypothetical protein